RGLAGEMTARRMVTGRQVHEGRPVRVAQVNSEGAAVGEDAVREAQRFFRRRPRNSARQATGGDLGYGGDQAPRVGILRLLQESRGRAELHELASIEYPYAISELRHRAEIVRDEQDRRLDLSMQRAREREELLL